MNKRNRDLRKAIRRNKSQYKKEGIFLSHSVVRKELKTTVVLPEEDMDKETYNKMIECCRIKQIPTSIFLNEAIENFINEDN